MKIKLIFGLGNPSKEYSNTYHNAGEMFVNYLSSELGSEPKKKDGELISIATIHEEEVILFTPSGPYFMNESGNYLRKYIKKIKPDEMLIVHDESDIPFGKFKFSFDSSSAGHKGVQSIIDTLRTKKFHRLRIGIRKKPGKALDFVLKKISKADQAVLKKVFEEAFSQLTKTIIA